MRASVRLLRHGGDHDTSAQVDPAPIDALRGRVAVEAVVAVGLEVTGGARLVGNHLRDAEVVDVELCRGGDALHVQVQRRHVSGEPVAALEGHPGPAGHAVRGACRDGVEPVRGLARHPALDRHLQGVLERGLSGSQANRHSDLIQEVLLEHGQDVQRRPVPRRRASRRLEAAEAGGGRLVGDGQDRGAARKPALRRAALEVVLHDLGACGTGKGERHQREQESGSCASVPKRERVPHGASISRDGAAVLRGRHDPGVRPWRR